MRLREQLTRALILIFALFATSVPRSAEITPLKSSELYSSRRTALVRTDAIAPDSLPRGAGQTRTLSTERLSQASPLTQPPSDRVTYTSFTGQTYTLNKFTGRYTQTLLPDSWIDGSLLTPAEVRRLLDSHDLTYAFYREMTGEEPMGLGLLTIAYIPLASSDYSGLGLLGTKGVEISDSQQTIEKLRAELKTRTTFSVVDHEEAHNFDLVSKYTVSRPADGHAWTSLLQAALRLETRDRDQELEPEESVKASLIQFDRYLSSSYDWNGLLTQNPQELPPPNTVWSGTILRLIQLKGVAFLRSYVSAVKSLRAAGPSISTSADDTHFRAIAAALKENSSCIASSWKWPLSADSSTWLQSNYGPAPSTLCQDMDGDAYTPLGGDTNDHDASVNPGRRESPNSLDDDSNLITDDIPVPESSLSASGDLPESTQSSPTLAYGSRLEAAIQSDSDVDTARIQIPATPGPTEQQRHIAISARTTTPNTEIQIEALYSTGQSTGILIYADDSRLPIRHYFTVIAGQEWTLRIKRSSANPFNAALNYQVSLEDADSFPASPATLPPSGYRPPVNPDGSRQLTARWNDSDWQELRAKGITHIRWWITGIGWSALQPAAQAPTLNWYPPPSSVEGILGYRVQPVRQNSDGTPDTILAPASQPFFFTNPDSGAAEEPPTAYPPAPIPRLLPLEPDARPAPSHEVAPECLSPSSITRITFTSTNSLAVARQIAQPVSTDALGLSHYPTELQGWSVTFDGQQSEILGYEQTAIDPNTLQPRISIEVITPDSFPASSTQIVINYNGRPVSSLHARTQLISPSLWTDSDGYAIALASPEHTVLNESHGLATNSLFTTQGRNITIFGTGFKGAPNSDYTNDLPGRPNVAESYTPAVLVYTDGTGRQSQAAIQYVGAAASGPYGLDQVIVNIPSSVAGAGIIELHIVTALGASLPAVDVKAKIRVN